MEKGRVDVYQIAGKPYGRGNSIAYFCDVLVSVVEDLALVDGVVFLGEVSWQGFFIDRQRWVEDMESRGFKGSWNGCPCGRSRAVAGGRGLDRRERLISLIWESQGYPV